MTVDVRETVSTVAYLIGVRLPQLIEIYGNDCIETIDNLKNDKDATIIRYLCKLRTSMMVKFKPTDDIMRNELLNIDSIEWFDHDNIKQLERWEIPIIKANYRSEYYMRDFNRLISENIDKCSRLFGDWINWNYIKSLFCIPQFNKPEVMKGEFAKYQSSHDLYPFHMYIHWEPYDCGNLLYNDGKFLQILYEMNGDEFTDRSKFKDAHEETKNMIYDFIDQSEKVEIVVDCENSDVYKLYGTLENLNDEELSKIEKIILFDDFHTTAGWDYLQTVIPDIPVEHVEVERVMDYKSLVDIKLTAGVCREHFVNKVDSFILCSSDSDFWGLISTIGDANFLVMYEYGKCGSSIKEVWEKHDISSCSIDDFCSAQTDDLKKIVLNSSLRKYLDENFKFDGKELAKEIFNQARITADDAEIDNFYNRYIKTLQLKNNDGILSLEIK